MIKVTIEAVLFENAPHKECLGRIIIVKANDPVKKDSEEMNYDVTVFENTKDIKKFKVYNHKKSESIWSLLYKAMRLIEMRRKINGNNKERVSGYGDRKASDGVSIKEG